MNVWVYCDKGHSFKEKKKTLNATKYAVSEQCLFIIQKWYNMWILCMCEYNRKNNKCNYNEINKWTNGSHFESLVTCNKHVTIPFRIVYFAIQAVVFELKRREKINSLHIQSAKERKSPFCLSNLFSRRVFLHLLFKKSKNNFFYEINVISRLATSKLF